MNLRQWHSPRDLRHSGLDGVLIVVYDICNLKLTTEPIQFCDQLRLRLAMISNARAQMSVEYRTWSGKCIYLERVKVSLRSMDLDVLRTRGTSSRGVKSCLPWVVVCE